MLIDTLLKSSKLEKFSDTVAGSSNLLAENLWDSSKALTTIIAQKATGKNVLVVTARSQEENRLLDDLEFFSDVAVHDFPSWEAMPSEKIAPSSDVAGVRYMILHALATERDAAHIVVTGVQALLQKVIMPDMLELMSMTVAVGDVRDFDSFIADLEDFGYYRRPVASDKGEFAVRGGIIDIFPITSPGPFRLEFWGDEVTSIRSYDPVAQKSVVKAKEFLLTPARELELIRQEKSLATLVDYLGDNTIIIFDDIVALEDKYIALEGISRDTAETFGTFKGFLDEVKNHQKVFFVDGDIEKLSSVTVRDSAMKNIYSQKIDSYGIEFSAFDALFVAERWRHPFQTLGDYCAESLSAEECSGLDIVKVLRRFDTITAIFVADTAADKKRFSEQLRDSGVEEPFFVDGYLSQGFVVADSGDAVIPHTEVTHRYKIRRQKMRSVYHALPAEMYRLDEGDIVVHRNDGIGRYIGMDRRPNSEGIDIEYLVIEYAEKAKQYVPLSQAYLVSKYIGASEAKPTLNTLGNPRWRKIREKTELSIIGYASELLDVYAKRALTKGYAYPADGGDFKAFEEDFSFVETEDQVSAISDIKRDMMSENAMDRLVCGDVGYGKTEVAMRAAFKAVADGNKQVAVLVPTTVLAMQHYDTFVERMCNFPVRIEVLSRYGNAKKTREIIKGVADGSVDIVIGTHRIISDDVVFKDLGLVIIDEEQRFGVRAKEKLRSVKSGVDCLALSATPIPRTLYMSLVGTRDMSTVNTPPHDRLPIQTAICEGADEILKAALLRELSRDGQAFVIHNRVETIYHVADRIKNLMPHARVIVAHGQMHADAINAAFHAFRNGNADILIATTIVENGVDVPNANTIIIDRADMYGLASLYQLRGRIGRWNRQAYAYFLIPQNLSEIAHKRLDALKETGGHGGGMRLAMRDLEIRGAGDILGTEQSGHIEAIGFNLYCKMLKRTVTSLRDKKAVVIDTKMEFPYDARLPDEYVNDPGLRMELYHRIGEASSLEEVESLFTEITDRFGPLPLPAEWLFQMARVKVDAGMRNITSIKITKHAIEITQKKGKQQQSHSHLIPQMKIPAEVGDILMRALSYSA